MSAAAGGRFTALMSLALPYRIFRTHGERPLFLLLLLMRHTR